MLLLTPLLLLFALVGHVALFVLPINLLYGTRFRGWYVTTIRWVLKAAIALGPLSFLWFQSRVLLQPIDAWNLPPTLQAYLALCEIFALGVVYATVRRWLRRAPVHQLANHTQLVDVARALGRKPVGAGKHAWFAHFPGNQIFQVDFVEKIFRLPQLPPAWDGLTILHITDLHLCGVPDREFYEHVLDRCATEPADLLVITGDILDSDAHYHWIAPLLRRLRWRLAAFAILGNHDCWLDVPRLEKEIESTGIELLGGKWKQFDVRGEPLLVIGNEVPWGRPAPDLSACPAAGFRLGLSHSPDTLPWAKANHIDLMLAGHNHGGQVRLPGLGPVLVPSKFSRRYDCGTFFEAPTLMYVSRGLGGTYPLRWNCRPEVTRVVVRR
jgi:uncharacterized protein